MHAANDKESLPFSQRRYLRADQTPLLRIACEHPCASCCENTQFSNVCSVSADLIFTSGNGRQTVGLPVRIPSEMLSTALFSGTRDDAGYTLEILRQV